MNQTTIKTTGFATLDEAKENVTEVFSTIVYDKSDNSYLLFCSPTGAKMCYPEMFYSIIGKFEKIGGMVFKVCS